MARILFYIALLTFASLEGWSQKQVIKLKNPSFEGVPHRGTSNSNLHRFTNAGVIPDWVDCGHKGETPPDLHTDTSSFFEVSRSPQHGKTFLGMVVRYNDTWERISQHLTQPLEKGKCYKLALYLSRDENYRSGTRRRANTDKEYFTKPCVLRIHGGDGYCVTREILAESHPIVDTQWRRYEFILKPKETWTHIELEAFYKTPVPFPYNGNLLLDNLEDIIEIDCPVDIPEFTAPIPKELELAMEDKTQVEKPEIKTPKAKPKTKPKKEVVNQEVNTDKPKEKILKELDAKTIKEGQKIRIDKLYFKADETAMGMESYEVMDEIYDFLKKNPEVVVEIGGHTNGQPAHDYCDRLSLARAESVSEYLVMKGIDEDRIKTKGYGKRNPIASNKSREGRKKNQRVEIKILSLRGQTNSN